jgi:hypothetical protein
MKTFTVHYTTKDKQGYLIDQSKTFTSNTDARMFIRGLQSTGNVVGLPVFVVG